MKEEYSNVKKYFQEQKDQAIMERILEVKDDWSDLLSIRNEIEEKQLYLCLILVDLKYRGEVYECFLYATFFYVYDYPYINAMMRVGNWSGFYSSRSSSRVEIAAQIASSSVRWSVRNKE